jgi:crotonobetainyl-CoA:carnitine CoA-transferase CaiB-like acyl-CoA transferase
MSQGPLSGIRVVELTTAWAGPMVGRVLAWFGAEVIHVESPTRSNSWRTNKEKPNPVNFPGGVAGDRPFDRTFLFNSQNGNKRSLILDLKTGEGMRALRDLLATADVLTCNFRPDMLRKMKLDYDSLAAVKPDIIVAELPAYGLEGPMADYAALGPTMEMAAGMAALIGYPGGQPEVTGPSYLDPIGGFNGAAAILTALLYRQQTGEGQHIEIPQVEGAMQFIGAELLAAGETGTDAPRDGNHRAGAAPHDAFPAKGDDQWVVIAVFSDGEWARLAAAIGQPDLAGDPRFATTAARLAHQDALKQVLSVWTSSRDKHAIADMLQAAGVASAPVQTPRDVAMSKHLAARNFFTPLERADLGRFPYPGIPIHLDRTPGGQEKVAPAFGADNAYVLGTILKRTPQEIAAMESSGAISDAPRPGA